MAEVIKSSYIVPPALSATLISTKFYANVKMISLVALFRRRNRLNQSSRKFLDLALDFRALRIESNHNQFRRERGRCFAYLVTKAEGHFERISQSEWRFRHNTMSGN